MECPFCAHPVILHKERGCKMATCPCQLTPREIQEVGGPVAIPVYDSPSMVEIREDTPMIPQGHDFPSPTEIRKENDKLRIENEALKITLRWALGKTRRGNEDPEGFAGKWNAANTLVKEGVTSSPPVCHSCKTVAAPESMRQLCDKCFSAGVSAERANPGEEFAVPLRKDV